MIDHQISLTVSPATDMATVMIVAGRPALRGGPPIGIRQEAGLEVSLL